MKDHDLVISEAAQNDFLEAMNWYEEQRTGLSKELELSIEASLFFIKRHPLAPAIRYKDVRLRRINRFPYCLHYRLEEEQIKIIAFFHVRRDPKKWYVRL